ncbi:MAG: hypothetical protein ABI539_02530 [Acidobacteriota bacterium]
MNTDSELLTYAVFFGSVGSEFAEKLKADHRLLWIPRVKPRPLGRGIIDLAQAAVSDDDTWVIFADPFCVDAVFNNGKGTFELADCIHVCAMGKTTASRLREFHVHTDIIPRPTLVDAALDSIIRFSGDNVGSIYYVGESADNVPLSGKFLPIRVYEAEFEDQFEVTRVKALIAGGAADILVFSQADDVHNFELLFRGALAGQILLNSIVRAESEAAFNALSERGVAVRYFDPERYEDHTFTSTGL